MSLSNDTYNLQRRKVLRSTGETLAALKSQRGLSNKTLRALSPLNSQQNSGAIPTDYNGFSAIQLCIKNLQRQNDLIEQLLVKSRRTYGNNQALYSFKVIEFLLYQDLVTLLGSI